MSAIDDRDTPGAGKVSHFNNAGASLPPKPVLDAVTGHLNLEAEIGGYEAADAAAAARDRTYQAIARLLGCTTDEIARSASAPWPISRRPGPRFGRTSPTLKLGKL